MDQSCSSKILDEQSQTSYEQLHTTDPIKLFSKKQIDYKNYAHQWRRHIHQTLKLHHDSGNSSNSSIGLDSDSSKSAFDSISLTTVKVSEGHPRLEPQI